jgi:uncharacterized membrane protein
MTLARPFQKARAAVVCLWLGLAALLLGWSLAGGATIGGVALAMLTAGPLLAPLAGLWAGRRRTYRWAPLALAPGLAWSLTELVANPAARGLAGLVALLAFLCLAGIVAALRSMPQA